MAKAMNSGWLFRIPTQARYGNGYIFSSKHITPEQAKTEVEEYLGTSIKVGKVFKFDAGTIDRSWIKNCCAVGLSAVFMEPLEASSIGTTIQQVFMLMHRIPNYTEESINKYNQSYLEIVTNTRDFIALHYISDREDTPFWKDQKHVPIPPALVEKLELWKSSTPKAEDFIGGSGYSLFGAINYFYILEGLGILDIHQVSKELRLSGDAPRRDASAYSEYLTTLFEDLEYVGHREFLQTLKEQE
jgi:tryptophan halogenase